MYKVTRSQRIFGVYCFKHKRWEDQDAAPSDSTNQPQVKQSVQIHCTDLIFNNKECRVLTCKDISKIQENAKLSADNKMLSLMASSVSHEMLTPLRCIIHLANGLEKKLKEKIQEDQSVGKEIDLVVKTAQLLLN